MPRRIDVAKGADLALLRIAAEDMYTAIEAGRQLYPAASVAKLSRMGYLAHRPGTAEYYITEAGHEILRVLGGTL